MVELMNASTYTTSNLRKTSICTLHHKQWKGFLSPNKELFTKRDQLNKILLKIIRNKKR